MTKQDDLLTKAIQNLKIDVPIMASRLVGDRIELWLYGGRQVTYPEPDPPPTPPVRSPGRGDSTNRPSRTKKAKQ